jgi:hypothetical protein
MMNPYQSAIDEARKELEELSAQQRELERTHEEMLKHYNQMKEILTNYIDTTRAIMNRNNGPIASAPLPSAVPATNVQVHHPDTPNQDSQLWKWAVFVMRNHARPFTVGDVLKAMSDQGYTITSRNRVQIMRKTLLNKPALFKKLEERGKFMLVENEKGVTEATP